MSALTNTVFNVEASITPLSSNILHTTGLFSPPSRSLFTGYVLTSCPVFSCCQHPDPELPAVKILFASFRGAVV